MLRSVLLTLALLITGTAARATAQSVVRVVDAEDKRPLPHATIVFRCLAGDCGDSSVVRMTDHRGVAAVPFKSRSAVAVRHVGYVEVRDTVEAGETLEVFLTPNSIRSQDIVVTGQYVPVGADHAAHDVRVIDRKEIEARAAQDLGELMSDELNVRLGHDPVLGGSLNIQGLSGQNVKVLVDGLPVVGRVGGNIDPNQLPVSNVERVEVVEGPLSVVYGTDALGGVVNLITDRRVGSGFVAEAHAYHESVGIWDVDGRMGALVGDTRLLFSGGRRFFGGFSDPDTTRYKEWKPKEQYLADWEATHYLGTFSLGYSGRFFHEYILNRGVPRPPYGETAFDDVYRTDRLTNRLLMQGRLDEDVVDLSVALSLYGRTKNTYVKDLVTLQEELTPTPSEHDTSTFTSWNIRGNYGAAPGRLPFSWRAGFDLNLDDARGGRIAGGEKNIGDYALFAGARYEPTGGFVIEPGLRYAYNTKYAAPVIPSLNLKYDADEHITLRASYARGFRSPSLRDLYFEFVDVNHNIRGNEDLRAEISDNLSGSVALRSTEDDRSMELTAQGFYNDVHNLITLAYVDGSLYSYTNIGTYRTTGLKLVGRLRRENLSLRLGASLIGRYNEFSESHSLATFLFAPEAVGSVIWRTPVLDLDFSCTYKYTGRLPSYALNARNEPTERFIEDYHMLDASIARSLLDDLLTLRIGGKNLLDVTEVGAAGVDDGSAHSSGNASLPVGWGRTFFLELGVAVR